MATERGDRPRGPAGRVGVGLVAGVARGVLGLLLVAALGASAGCASSASPPTGPAVAKPPVAAAAAPAAPAAPPPAVPVTMRVAYTTASGIIAPVWIAHEAGLFREEGIDSTLQFVTAGAPMSAAVRNGEIDLVVGAGGPSIVQGVFAGVDHVVVGMTGNVLPGAVYAQATIQRPDDLRGGVLAVSRFKAIADIIGRQGLQPQVQQPLAPDDVGDCFEA